MKRGEIWMVDLNPTVGDEIFKTRPCVILGKVVPGSLKLCIVVPLTEWKANFAQWPWLVQVAPSAKNGLTKPSTANVMQVRAVSTLRFQRLLGTCSDPDMERIVAALEALIEP